jgi:hypothetical protein
MKVNGLRHGLLDGLCNKDIWRENTEWIKTKKHRQSSDYQCFLPVGVTGFEPATTRPPGADFKSSYFSISLIFRTYTTEHQMLIFY